jgi:hypothetical protein
MVTDCAKSLPPLGNWSHTATTSTTWPGNRLHSPITWARLPCSCCSPPTQPSRVAAADSALDRPYLVTEFVARLRDPDRRGDAAVAAHVPGLTRPREAADLDQLEELLLAGPDRLNAESARYCLRAGIGHSSPELSPTAASPTLPPSRRPGPGRADATGA